MILFPRCVTSQGILCLFDLPPRNMKKRKMILIKRLDLFNNPNKHQLTPNLQSNFLSPGMGMDCISESIEMIFNQLLLLWLHYVLFQSKSNELLQWILLKQLDKNETYKTYSLFVNYLLKIIDVANCVPRAIFFLNSPFSYSEKMRWERGYYVPAKATTALP